MAAGAALRAVAIHWPCAGHLICRLLGLPLAGYGLDLVGLRAERRHARAAPAGGGGVALRRDRLGGGASAPARRERRAEAREGGDVAGAAGLHPPSPQTRGGATRRTASGKL